MVGEEIHVVLPVVVGIVIGIVEAYFVYEDENMTSGKQFIGDMWHGLVFSVSGVLAASNIPYIIAQGWIPEVLTGFLFVDANNNSLVFSVAITLFMLVKMVGSHAIKGVSGQGFKEKFWHKLVIALAVGFSPYYIMMLYEPLSGLQAAVPWLPF